MNEEGIKFKYQKITNHYLGQRMHMFKYVGVLFAVILLFLEIFSGGPDVYDYRSIIIIFSFLAFSMIMHFFLKPYDSIILTDKYLVIKKYAKPAIKFNLMELKSFSSTTKLVLEFNSGKTETISYSMWLFPMIKVRELTKALDEIVNE